MKIKVKNLQQETYEVEVDPTKTVLDLKAAIFNQLGAPYNIENQTLIYAGSIMQDNQIVENLKIDEKKFIVCLVKIKSATPANTPPTAVPSNVPPPAEQPQNSTPPLQMNEYVQTIMELGYSEDQVREALAASMNDPDTAVEFLISGSNPIEEASNDANNNTTPFEFLRNQPQFAQMRNLIRQHPELLDEVLRQVARSNPSLMTMISENREAFLEMLNRDDGNEDGNTLTIEVTQEDKDAIDRLKALGFPEDLVIQAYFACDKNENMAANFLLASALTDD